MDKSNISVCSTVCNECPFSSSSPSGYLGDFTVEDTLNAFNSELLFYCHLTRDSKSPKLCKGFLLSSIKSCVAFGKNTETREELKKQVALLIKNNEPLKNILSKWEFAEHHKQ